jgi:hypothetical protein
MAVKLINNRSRWHSSLTDDVIAEAVERHNRSLDNPGFCLACGLENGGCEPDACGYLCEGCGEKVVYGAEELLQRIAP